VILTGGHRKEGTVTPRLRLWVIHGLVCLLTAAAAWALGVGTIVIHNNTDATLTIWAVNQDPSENTREVTVGPNQKRTLEWFLPMGRNEVCARPKLTQLGAICKGYWVSGQASKVQEWEIFPGDWGKSVILDGPTRSTRTSSGSDRGDGEDIRPTKIPRELSCPPDEDARPFRRP